MAGFWLWLICYGLDRFTQWIGGEHDRKSLTASDLIGRLSNQYHIRDLVVREPDIEATIRRIYEERLLEKQ